MERYLRGGKDEEQWSIFEMDAEDVDKRVQWEVKIKDVDVPELLRPGSDTVLLKHGEKLEESKEDGKEAKEAKV